MKIEFHDGSRRATLLENAFIYGIHIPEGFTFNGANIPIWVTSLIGLTRWHPKIRKAALVHDYLYSVGKKQLADKIFKQQLKKDGCNRLQVYLCHRAVKLFGEANNA